MKAFSGFVITRYKWLITFWLILLIGLAVFAIRLPGLLEGDGFRMDGEQEEVSNMLTQDFHQPDETMFLVFEGKTDAEISDALTAIKKLNITAGIISPLDETAQYKEDISYAMLQFDDSESDKSGLVTEIRDAVGTDDGITLTGQSPITKDINAASQKDLMVAEAIGLPIALIVLLFAFGTIVASIVPILIGVATIVTSFGILALFGETMDLSIFVLNIIPMLGLALSIDFALLFISRYREERKRQSIPEAVRTTIETAGRSIIFSAFCVFIGLGAMLLIRVDIFQNIALGGMIVVSMAVLASITLLPAVLLVLKERIDKGKILRVKTGTDRWRTFAEQVIKRPVLITIGALLLLGIALIPVRNMTLTIPQIDSLPLSYDTRSAYENMEDAFGMRDESTAFVIAERSGGWVDEDGLNALQDVQEALEKDPLTGKVTTIFSESGIDQPETFGQALQVPEQSASLQPLLESFISKDLLMISVTLEADGASSEAQEWARNWSEKETPWNLQVGGEAKFNQEIFDEITDNIIYALLIIIVSTFIILMVAFRSLLIPFKAILMNIIGLSASFGLLVYIFQYGHFGLHPGTIALIIPVIVFSLVFGLSMDYEVFLISRMQESYLETGDNDKSTVEGLASTSKVITSAALIMIVLTGAFAFTDVMPVKQIGVGIAIAVAIDATIIRLLLVPSLMKLFGDWNWWLPFRKKS
ncbi:MMPL family transporter [Sporosarcina gallistercoris]|uniref:MMPL family transporter n=1 Tax=Sporosarcina gallistercoris TaxID=2762245 RepID=A0ABR8PH14_9BACL|nr:MMPL family transporter [Sporosarcina gallistercoris]MBD7907453.1 MMPL family transporter [Sporosarcina gallistercoris]